MKIKYQKSVVKDVKKIKNKKVRKNVRDAVNLIKTVSSIKELVNVKKLAGHPSAYRMRIGDYRLGFYLEKDTIILARFVNRKDIYKLFP